MWHNIKLLSVLPFLKITINEQITDFGERSYAQSSYLAVSSEHKFASFSWGVYRDIILRILEDVCDLPSLGYAKIKALFRKKEISQRTPL